MKKKIFAVITSIALCLALIFVFVGCMDNQNTNTTGEDNSSESENLIAMSATSSALILDEMQNASASVATAKEDSSLEGTALTEEEIEEVKVQLALLENYMGENAPVVTESELTSGEEYYGEYRYRMTIVTKDMHGNAYQYNMYFNMEKLGEKTEYDDGRRGETASGNRDFEFEEEFRLNGILVSGENVYELSGIKENETEVEEGETETECSYKMTIKKSADEYVVFEQSVEEEGNEKEQKYEYKVYAQNELKKEFCLEFENEFGESEVEMETRENGNVFRVAYKSEMRNGKERIKAEITKGNRICEVMIRVEGKGSPEDPYRHIYTYGDIEDVDYDD